MKHCILAKFRPEAGDWRAYLPQIREIFSAAGDIPGVRGAEVLPGCVDRDNRYHVLIRLDMDPAAHEPSHHRRQQQENGNGGPANELFLFGCENVLVHNNPRLVDGIIIPRFSRCF